MRRVKGLLGVIVGLMLLFHAGGTTAYADDVEQRFRQGFKWLAIANDTGTFAHAAQQRLQQAKDALKAATS